MTSSGLLQIAIFAAVIAGLTKPLGYYMARIFTGEQIPLGRFLRPLERGLYRISGVNPDEEQNWLHYAFSLLTFNLCGTIALYGIQRLQLLLPFNPQAIVNVAPDLALNTAVSFTTNTSWQSYAGESSLSYFTQMTGITVHSFLSAASGIAVAIALIRGFARKSTATIGNFWGDMVRATLYVLLPVCIAASILLILLGVPQTLEGPAGAATLEGSKQLIARGPVASQIAIKMLSSDGGGFFNANSAHPFENPTALTNLIEMVLIFLVGAALTNTFGRMIGDQRQGWALLAVMGVLFLLGALSVYGIEGLGNPAFANAPGGQVSDALFAGGNMEGKEVRFGIAGSSLFSTVTTDSSSGAVNAMHDSFMPLGGGLLMVNMMLGEVIVGGVGSGLFGMLLFCIVTVFVGGLMVGRTPEYVGKKIQANEVKMTMLALLVVPGTVLGLTSIACVIGPGLTGMVKAGPHGFSQILYAYTSAAATNGSAFAGLNANTVFYNFTLALAMFLGRFLVILPVLAIAGSLAGKPAVPVSAGTLPTRGGLFIVLLTSVIMVVGGLTFLPALTLGPVAEHLAMRAGQLF
ncbi:MAG: potassium-transporting ATPase subunit KdpA [Rhodomicrobium sp.]